MVRRLVIAGTRVAGVEVESGGERFTVEGEEIILSAGAIGSPHILMLSGVGPADNLRSVGIPVGARFARSGPKPEGPSSRVRGLANQEGPSSE